MFCSRYNNIEIGNVSLEKRTFYLRSQSWYNSFQCQVHQYAYTCTNYIFSLQQSWYNPSQPSSRQFRYSLKAVLYVLKMDGYTFRGDTCRLHFASLYNGNRLLKERICSSRSKSKLNHGISEQERITYECDLAHESGQWKVKTLITHKTGPEVIKLFSCSTQLSMEF